MADRKGRNKKDENVNEAGDTDATTVSLKDLQRLVESAVRKQFEEFKLSMISELKELFTEHLSVLEKRIQTLEQSSTVLVNKISEIETDLNCKTNQLLNLETALDQLKNTTSTDVDIAKEVEALRKLSREGVIIANDNEQYSRRMNIRIHGMKIEADDKNVKSTVVNWLNTTLKLSDLTYADVENAHIVPSKQWANSGAHKTSNQSRTSSSSSGSANSVIVRFARREVKERVLRSRRIFKNSPTTLTEDLTTLNNHLLTKLYKNDRVEKTWTWNGRIFAQLKNDVVTVVKPFQTIDELYAITNN